jgi:hypothetical protein
MAVEDRHENQQTASAAGRCGGYADDDLEAIFTNWPFLAALAWEGYLTQGEGAIVVTVAGVQADIGYCSAAPPACHAHLVERYNPNEQLVVVVRREGAECAYLVSGQPSPQECFESVSAHTMKATVH